MSDERFLGFETELLEAIGIREMDAGNYERAVGYRWERRPGSCLVTDQGVEDLADVAHERRSELLRKYLHESDDRVRLLTYGANGSPGRLALKLAHLSVEDHEALIVAGDLAGFDVAPHAHPPLFSSMAATLMPSPGTSVRVAVLFLTPAQFTALWWTELTYVVGSLEGIRLVLDVADEPLDRVMLFVSRCGAFCLDGEPVAMAAIPARNRRSAALTQTRFLMPLRACASAKALKPEIWSRPRSRIPRPSWPTTSHSSAPRLGRSPPNTGQPCQRTRPTTHPDRAPASA